ncbi:MAG: SH3 domain-containing protein [Anaerolineae bacterium]|nr:SH3 domain-containing protein [Anaerolineae bacterium]
MFTRIRRAGHSRLLLAAITGIVLVALAAVAFPLTLTPVAAQPGGDIQYNVPVIVTLDSGGSITRTFAVSPGDTVDIILSRLTNYTFTAVLIDPNQAPTPLTPGADGNIATRITNAAVGGVYTLVIQASEGSGDLLIQVNSTSVPPSALLIGESTITVEDVELRFELVPPEGMATTVLVLSSEPATIPGFTLTDNATGDVIMTMGGGLLPSLAITLPAQQTYTLVVQPVAAPQSLTIRWDEGSATSTGTTEDDDTEDSGDSDDSQEPPTPTVIPPTEVTCQMVFAGQVNVRSGPGLQYTPPIGQIQAGTVLPVTGHNGNFNWYQVIFADGVGWVAGTIEATTLQGQCTALPVVTVPPPGSASATPAASATVLATVAATPTVGPSPTATATVSGPTATATATVQGPVNPTATVQGPVNPTATFTPSFTPTTLPPTATFTPSYTPTTPPAAQVAPEDARFNNPLTIQLDNTTSVLDFVSYPGGDREDRVRWDITGMNSNSAMSGGRARLVISASCFGTNTDQIQFFTGGQTFSCGQTLVDQEVTFNSKTGSVVITAVGGEGTYVQWVLTGTATRVN